MKKQIYYDKDLNIEIYSFKNVQQEFPNHFHNYYVIGFIEKGSRLLNYRNKKTHLKENNVLLLNPKDSHGCVSADAEPFNYIAINISESIMLDLVFEITGEHVFPAFSRNVVNDEELSLLIKNLYRMVIENAEGLEKEEMMIMLVSVLIERYGGMCKKSTEPSNKIQDICNFIESHYAEKISLNQLCNLSKVGKSTLLREFTRIKGVTPYRYLQSVRIDTAKKLLENGTALVDAAIQTGFSDQSHFTRFFQLYIGLSPAEYTKIFKNNRGMDK